MKKERGEKYPFGIYRDSPSATKEQILKRYNYIEGATEQHEIDIEKSTQLLIDILKNKLNINVDCDDIYRIVNDFKQAMKGE